MSVSSTKMILLDVQEASSYLRIKKSTMYSWVHFRKIEHIKIGKRVLFDIEVLNGIIEKGTVTPIL